MMRDRRIVVTRGAGFIGSNIARALCEENEVTVIDNLSTGRRENLANIEERVRFVRGDINDLNILKRELESVDDPLTTNRNNIDGTLSVLVAARDCGVKRMVFASSSSVYGDTPELAMRESFTPKPLSPLCSHEAGGRAVLQGLPRSLRSGDGGSPVLQRLRAWPGSTL